MTSDHIKLFTDMKKICFSLIFSFLVFFGPFCVISKAQEEKTVIKGKVIDLVCYLDHGAEGEKHLKCAKTCIESGLPVGLKGEDGKLYIIVGEHKPINKELVSKAQQVITVKGKVVSKEGFNLIENAEIVQ
ncbi:hypothetical protein [Candidatus Methylacidiphilum infernorum]|nr:hypothetical protein [Candidatus Methylacidiphilum infernorum]